VAHNSSRRGGQEAPTEERELTLALATVVVEDIAPDEMAVFDETAEDYFADPDAVLDPRHRDEAVGFGIEVALLTPVVLAVARTVVEFLGKLLLDAASDVARPHVAAVLRRLFRIPQREGGTPVSPPRLTPEQLEQVRTVAHDRARALGLPEDRAQLLADSVVGGVTRAA